MSKAIDPEAPEAPPLPLITTVRAVRTARGLTMAQLAVMANMSSGALGRIETATDHAVLGQTGIGKLFALAGVLMVPPADLYPMLKQRPEPPHGGRNGGE